MIFSHCEYYVVLATFKYCNNVLGNVEYVEPEEWREIYNSLGIAWSGNTHKWSDAMKRECILIRKEFLNEEERERGKS